MWRPECHADASATTVATATQMAGNLTRATRRPYRYARHVIKLARDGGVLRVTLARPERRNALDAQLIGDLTSAFADVGDARVVVLAGEGESFCAGADIEWMRSSAELSYEENLDDARRLRALLDAVDGCPVPVVARAQGQTFGGGCGLLACADVVVAAPGAQFAFSEVRLGIVPATISPFVLARVGRGAARRYFVTGERFDGATALRIGLVHVLADDLDETVARAAAAVLAGGPEAVRAAKKIARAPLRAEESARLIAERRTSAEGQEGLSAFLEKRRPRWHAG
jgi:enoyl-CoA hydratase/carnithine racemase